MAVLQKPIPFKYKLLNPYLLLSEDEVGVDEVGRGCGAGPVVAAAVILPAKVKLKYLRDSKMIDSELRYKLRYLIEKVAVEYAIGVASVEEIDEFNILEATYLAMHRALEKLRSQPKLLLIDGNRFKNRTAIPHETIIQGDDKVLSIAAASVIAKTWRDDHMIQLHEKHPSYHWHTNKGYLTRAHRNACYEYGLTEHHRKTFRGMVYDENFEVGDQGK